MLAPFLLYWQANAPVADFASAASDPAVHGSYYAPLLRELERLGIGYSARPARIEVVPTVDHWEARFLAAHVLIARGWERQLDTERDALFYEGSAALTASRYRAWLLDDAVSYVALPDAPLDYSAKSEAAAAAEHAPAVPARSHGARRIGGCSPCSARAPLAPARRADAIERRLVHAADPARGHVHGPHALHSLLGARERTRLRAACPGGWTLLRATSAGSVRVVIDFSPGRVFDHGPRCR